MTVVAAGTIPVLSDAEPFGIVIAADCRLTVTDARATQYFDRGKKIFQVGTHAGYAYSGNAFAALEVARALRQYFESCQRPLATESTVRELSELLKAGDKRLTDSLDSRYQSFLGFCSQDSKFVMLFQSMGDLPWFKSTHGRAKGDPIVFGSGLNSIERIEALMFEATEHSESLRQSRDVPNHALALAGPISVFVSEGLEPTVGGGVQVAAITQVEGFVPLGISRRDAAGNLRSYTPRSLVALP
jgi:hypothetical protein